MGRFPLPPGNNQRQPANLTSLLGRTDILSPEMSESLEKLRKKAKKYNEDLRKRAKSYEALIIPVEAIVESVLGNTASIYASRGPTVIGGSNPTYQSGTRSSLEITIKANQTPLRKVTFPEILPIYAGDSIRAYIFRGKEEYEKDESTALPGVLMDGFGREREPLLVERELKEKEPALKIEVLHRRKGILATYITT